MHIFQAQDLGVVLEHFAPTCDQLSNSSNTVTRYNPENQIIIDYLPER